MGVLTYLSNALAVQWLQITTAISASPQWPFELGGELSVGATTCLAWSATYCWSACWSSSNRLGQARQPLHFHPVSLSWLFSAERGNWNCGISETFVHKEINLRNSVCSGLKLHWFTVTSPCFVRAAEEGGTNTNLRVYTEQCLQEKNRCQPSWMSWRTSISVDYLEITSACMSHAGDILCTN